MLTYRIEAEADFEDSGRVYYFGGFTCPVCSKKGDWYLDDSGACYFICALGCRHCGSVFARNYTPGSYNNPIFTLTDFRLNNKQDKVLDANLENQVYEYIWSLP